MAEIKRIYVEKKEGCNIEASQLLADIKENLGLTNLTGLRILNRYDVEDIAVDVFFKSLTKILTNGIWLEIKNTA